MLSNQIKKILLQRIKGKMLFNEPMKNHTSFRIGGPADVLIIPEDEGDLKNLIRIVNKNRLILTIIGNGTKLLVSDEGISGIIVKISGCLNNLLVRQNCIKAGAGYLLANLSIIASDSGLSGLEFAVSIPGTIGGGIIMNAGAHRSMISDIITNVTTISRLGQIKIYSKESLQFGYRQSIFQNSDDIVLSAELTLKEGIREDIREKMHEYKDWRREKQPLNMPNAGSIFKNPVTSASGLLIDSVGLGGLRIGDAEISKKHANFIINLGNAKASDVIELMHIAQVAVFREFGIKLFPEIKLIGIPTMQFA